MTDRGWYRALAGAVAVVALGAVACSTRSPTEAPSPATAATEPVPATTAATRSAPTPTQTQTTPPPVRTTTANPVTHAPAPVRTTVAAPRTDPQFGTCKEAIANGYGPYYRGRDPEYYWYRDADHDGIDCER